jgi:hypothetical protein
MVWGGNAGFSSLTPSLLYDFIGSMGNFHLRLGQQSALSLLIAAIPLDGKVLLSYIPFPTTQAWRWRWKLSCMHGMSIVSTDIP